MFYYRPQRSCGKEMFSQACVKNSVHISSGMHGGGGGGRGVCMAGGQRGHVCVAGEEGVFVGGCMAGEGGMCGRGHVQWWGVHGGKACVAGETAIAAGGMHSTGMRSCFEFF